MVMPIRRRHYKHLLSWERIPYDVERRGQIAVGSNKQRAVKSIAVSIGNKACSDVNVGFLLLMLNPVSTTFIASPWLGLEVPHVAGNAAIEESFNIFDMTLMSVTEPRCIGRKIYDGRQLLSVAGDRFAERPQVDPLEVRFLEIIYSVVEIEPVDVGSNPSHSAPASEK